MSDRTTVIFKDDSDRTTVIFKDDTVVYATDATIIVASDNAGPGGPTGPAGPAGPVPIYLGPTPPINTSLLWVDTSI